MIVLIASMIVAGCTPLGENIARRNAAGVTVEEGSDIAVQVRALEGDQSVDPATAALLRRYGDVIHQCAVQYGFDWRLVLAIIRQESRFEAAAESHRGASGLMQIMPVTQREVADRLNLDDSGLPASNIKIGVYYLRKIYGMFEGVNETDRLKLALASYNAGLGRVYDAQQVAAYLGDNPTHWQAVREMLPLLSRRYSSLHQHVWSQDRPKNGWFGGARETVAYVDSVMAHYVAYVRELN